MPVPRDVRLAALARLEQERCVPLEHLAGQTWLRFPGCTPARVSVSTLKRWATDGKAAGRGRVWLDVIVRGESWLSSAAAVGRFLAALAATGRTAAPARPPAGSSV